jgi:SAM-dependent methyltransferase
MVESPGDVVAPVGRSYPAHWVPVPLPPVLVEIAPGDGMFSARDPLHYWAAGHSAMACVRAALWEVGKVHSDVQTILDLPCGHGRVLRFLRTAFRHATLTACDLVREGVDFCARAFDARPVYSSPNPNRIDLPDTYDLIWVGSLMTHLPPARWDDFFRLFARALRPGGLCLVTSHGPTVARWLRDGRVDYGVSDLAGLLADFARDGFGYRDYAGQPGYGVSLATRAWVCARVRRHPGLRFVAWWDRGWDHHQDVLVVQKAASDPID